MSRQQHERKCWGCGNVAQHASRVTPGVCCKKCGSQDTRATKKRHVITNEMARMLADVSMLDQDEDNGPGRVVCPVCGAGITMRWHWGKRLDSPDEITHKNDCPVAWAKRECDE